MIELSIVQDAIYSIFVEFDRVCRKYKINYSMEGGTLLGAVKYGGFVPWDDDIDVIMLRRDYETFIKVAPSELGDNFFLQSYNNVSQFPLNYAKICLNGTKICDYDYSHLSKMNHGIFMDIFPVDYVYSTKYRTQCSLVGVLTGARKTKLHVDVGAHGIRKIIYGSLSLLPMNLLIKSINALCTMYNNCNTDCVYEVCNSNRKFAPLSKEVYESFVELRFRDRSFLAVKEYDLFLKSRFGNDYMITLPDVENRRPSHNQNIIFEA